MTKFPDVTQTPEYPASLDDTIVIQKDAIDPGTTKQEERAFAEDINIIYRNMVAQVADIRDFIVALGLDPDAIPDKDDLGIAGAYIAANLGGGGGGGIQPEIRNAGFDGAISPAANSAKAFNRVVSWWQLSLLHTTQSGLVISDHFPRQTPDPFTLGAYAGIRSSSIVSESAFTILQEPAAGQATPTFFDNSLDRGVKVFFIANSTPGTYRWTWTWTGSGFAVTGTLRIDLDPL